MKTLILVRHAKSSWEEIGIDDAERPLNERGKKDAPQMAVRPKNKKIHLDVIISSPAKRAYKTARYFAEEFGLDKKEILVVNKLYGASVGAFLDVIASIKDEHKTAAIFSHNPGITEFANTLTGVRVDNIPTSGVFAVQVTATKWADFATAEKNFLFFDYPKNPIGEL